MCTEKKYFPGEAHCNDIVQDGFPDHTLIRQVLGNKRGDFYNPACAIRKEVRIDPSDWMYTDQCEPLGVLDGPFNEQAFVS